MLSRCGPYFAPRRPISPAFSRQQYFRVKRAPVGFEQCGFRGYRANFGGRPQYKRFGASSASILQRWAARPTFYRDVTILSLGTGGVYMYNLEEVPISGRRRFNIVSPELEASVSQQTMDQIKQEYRGQFLPPYDPRVRQVQRVLDRLIPFAEQAGLTGVDWEVHVIHSPEQNAFVIPGGKVFLFTGILGLCKTDDDIAAILGHEIAHVVAHHPAERMSKAPFIFLGALALWTFDFSFYMSQMLIDVFLSRPGSRKQEAEADYIGLMMMSQGCYMPEAAAGLWERMEKIDQASPPEILSTHPSHHNRQEKIRGWLPEAHAKQEESACHELKGFSDQFSRAFSQFRL